MFRVAMLALLLFVTILVSCTARQVTSYPPERARPECPVRSLTGCHAPLV